MWNPWEKTQFRTEDSELKTLTDKWTPGERAMCERTWKGYNKKDNTPHEVHKGSLQCQILSLHSQWCKVKRVTNARLAYRHIKKLCDTNLYWQYSKQNRLRMRRAEFCLSSSKPQIRALIGLALGLTTHAVALMTEDKKWRRKRSRLYTGLSTSGANLHMSQIT